MTCIGNSGELPKELTDAITDKDLVAAAVLSGNRNFEGRVHLEHQSQLFGQSTPRRCLCLSRKVDIDFEMNQLEKEKMVKMYS